MQNLKTGCVNMPEKKHLNKTFYSNESNLLTRCYSRRLKVTVFLMVSARRRRRVFFCNQVMDYMYRVTERNV